MQFAKIERKTNLWFDIYIYMYIYIYIWTDIIMDVCVCISCHTYVYLYIYIQMNSLSNDDSKQRCASYVTDWTHVLDSVIDEQRKCSSDLITMHLQDKRNSACVSHCEIHAHFQTKPRAHPSMVPASCSPPARRHDGYCPRTR